MERMARCAPDVVSVDQRVDLRDAIARIGPGFAVQARAAFVASHTSGLLSTAAR